MNILYIAYSCLPNKGSEEKIGWNIPVECTKHNKVFVVTKEEHREKICAYLKENKIDNIKFYYVDIKNIYKKIFKGVMYSIRLNIWHKKALPLVKKICKTENIDVIHQITPIEFRSIGRYGEIENTKFVCGPLGGGEFLPKGLKSFAKGYMLIEYIRTLLNRWYKFRYKFSKQLQKCDYIMFANNETQNYLSDLVCSVGHTLYFDNGISENDISATDKVKSDKFVMLVAGRLAYRKGHKFLFSVLKELPDNIEYECRIIGEGPMGNKLKQIVEKNGLSNKIVFTGRIKFEEMKREYENASIFVMPSIRETTGAVLLEAMSNGVPVVTINKFGGPVLFNNSTSYLYDGESLKDYKNSLYDILIHCKKNPDELVEKGNKLRKLAQENTWTKKMEFYNEIYKSL